MLKRSRSKWPLAKKLRIAFLFATALSLCLLLAAGIGFESNMELRLIGMHDNRLVMLLEDSSKIQVYYKDISDGGGSFTKVEGVPESGRAFFIDGGTLGIAEIFGDELDVGTYPFDTNLEREEYCLFSFAPNEDDKLAFTNAGPNVYNMYIVSPDRDMRFCEAMFEPEDEVLLTEVDFLDSTQGGWVYAYAGGVLRRWTGSGFESAEEYRDVPCPQKLVGENVYIDENSLLVRIRDGTAEMVDLDIGDIDPAACYGTDGYVTAADSSGVVHKFDWSGEDVTEIGMARIEGKIHGIIEDYVLAERDGQLYLEQLIFNSPGEETDPTSTPTLTPTPDPTPTSTPIPDESQEPTPSQTPDSGTEGTPSPEPEPSSTPVPDEGDNEPGEETPSPSPTGGNDDVGKLIEEIQFKELTGENGKYAAMLAGARVADLREIYKPQSIEVFTQDDSKVFESILKTGMKIRIPLGDGKSEEIPVIIRGDCNGDGKVNKSDITFASLYIINAAYAETEVQFMAMDMNDDGEVNIWDLPLIATETRRKG